MGLVRELLSRSTADGSRTNVLNHLQWMIAALIAVLVSASLFGISEKLIWLFAVLLCVFIICYLITHFYFMFKNPDALRSEKFTIQKMALERGLIGDNVIGMHEITRGITSDTPLLDSSAEEQGQ